MNMPVDPEQVFRRNGFELPIHPLQITAWCFLILITFLFLSAMAPQLVPPWSLVIYTIFGTAIFVSVATQIVATYIDPVDPNAGFSLSQSSPALFDPSKHLHVIEGNYCHICRCHVASKTKHCRPCNKCVIEFDHHCRWLNNCVGARNYKWFFTAMTSSMVAAMIVTAVGLLEFTAYYTDSTTGRILIQYSGFANTTSAISHKSGFTVLSLAVEDEVWQAITALTTLLALLVACLLVDLLSLHIYLCLNGLTTYRYLNERLMGRDIHRCRCRYKKKSQVVPKPPPSPRLPESSESSTAEKLEYTEDVQKVKNDFNDNFHFGYSDVAYIDRLQASLSTNQLAAALGASANDHTPRQTETPSTNETFAKANVDLDRNTSAEPSRFYGIHTSIHLDRSDLEINSSMTEIHESSTVNVTDSIAMEAVRQLPVPVNNDVSKRDLDLNRTSNQKTDVVHTDVSHFVDKTNASCIVDNKTDAKRDDEVKGSSIITGESHPVALTENFVKINQEAKNSNNSCSLPLLFPTTLPPISHIAYCHQNGALHKSRKKDQATNNRSYQSAIDGLLGCYQSTDESTHLSSASIISETNKQTKETDGDTCDSQSSVSSRQQSIDNSVSDLQSSLQ